MCDEAKLADWAKQAISRRRFGAVAGGAAMLAACNDVVRAPTAEVMEGAIAESPVTFETADGTMDAFFVHPATSQSPGVIFWPDIASLREAKRNMARRLAKEGYAVLVLNPYYRDVSGEQFADFAAFIDEGGFQKVRPWREKLDAEAIGRDASAAVNWLDEQPSVDTDKGIGTQGYCMGGPFTIWSAAAAPSRIKAAASFHGGGLVREDDPMSPHNMLDEVDARLLIAIAEDDHAKDPSAKLLFAKAAGLAAVPAKIDVYEGDHGWTVPDSPAYAEPAAQRAYGDLLELYRTAL
ncbi:dienelactone hydrolase family protein [Erythrobacter sp.]|jgi:carboxymethylenebutenolidase|uniref:dienelactone hydrolase family protein n=1 Tax=Erythrobacter sp. TaxID=1042 RepID=UPI002EBC6C40|nr:dienelactone hydrolase family protein [Erythrobacter sp.]